MLLFQQGCEAPHSIVLGEPHLRTWISIMWAFFCLRPILDIWVCANTRITVQCFFISSSSEVTPLSPLVYFFTYLVKAFFLDLYLCRAMPMSCADNEPGLGGVTAA